MVEYNLQHCKRFAFIAQRSIYTQSHRCCLYACMLFMQLFILLGLYGAYHTLFLIRPSRDWSFAFQYMSVALIGLGSAAYHATLLHASQQSDETPMVWSI